MPNEKIAQMIEDAPGQVSGIEDSIVQVDNQITELQEQQDVFVTTLEQIYTEVMSVLTPLCDLVYQGANFYGGSGIGTIDSNIVNWILFNNVSGPSAGSSYYDISMNPPQLKIYDLLLPFTPYIFVTFDDTDIHDKYEEFEFIIDSIHHPLGFTGTYGTKENIAMMNNGKNTIIANKDKLLDTQTKLARFGE